MRMRTNMMNLVALSLACVLPLHKVLMYILYYSFGVYSAWGGRSLPVQSKVYLHITQTITTVCVVYIPFAFGKFYTGTGFIVFIVRLRKEL